MKTMYIVYDTKDNDVVVCVGNIDEIVKFFNATKGVIYDNITRKTLKDRRYKIESSDELV